MFEDQALIVVGEGWDSGIVGLVAGRLCEKYHYPAIVMSQTESKEDEESLVVGSCRSIPGVNIHAMLTACQRAYHTAHPHEDLFLRFGGHEQAAGLTMRAALVPELRHLLNRSIREQCDLTCYIPEKLYDAKISLRDVTISFIEQMKVLEPTGFGNPAPIFLTERADVQQAVAVGATKDHLKIKLLADGDVRDGIGFHMGDMSQQNLHIVDVLYVPTINTFMGRTSAQLQITAIRPSAGTSQIPEQNAMTEALIDELKILSVEHDEAKAKPITMAAIQDLLKDKRGTLLIGHERELANRITMENELDAIVAEVTDFGNISVVLCMPKIDQLRDVWNNIVLLDGDLLPGELAMIHSQCPRASLYMKEDNPLFKSLLDSLTLTREEHLVPLYKCLRENIHSSLNEIAQKTALTLPQIYVGLEAFAQVELIQYNAFPFSIRLLPPSGAKKDMEKDTPILRYLHHR